MKLYLVRHAQSQNNAVANAGSNRQDPNAGRHLRSGDPALTEIGQAQAGRVAEYLKASVDKTDVRDGITDKGTGHCIDRLYCSPMLRALQTAESIGNALGLSPGIWLDVHEEGGVWLNRGDGRGRVGHGGLTRTEMQERFPGFVVPDAVTEQGWWHGPIETREQLIARAERVAIDIHSRHADTDERIAIVTHGTFLNCLAQQLLHGRHMASLFFSTHNTGIHRLDYVDGLLKPRYMNRIDHLPLALVT